MTGGVIFYASLLWHHRLSGNRLDGAEAITGAILLDTRGAAALVDLGTGGTTFTMWVDALVASPALGVSRDGQATGTVREPWCLWFIRRGGEAVFCDPAVFEGFLRLQAARRT